MKAHIYFSICLLIIIPISCSLPTQDTSPQEPPTKEFSIREFKQIQVSVDTGGVEYDPSQFFHLTTTIDKVEGKDVGYGASIEYTMSFKTFNGTSMLPAALNVTRSQAEGYSLLPQPSIIKFFEHNEELGFELSMRFALSTSIVEARKVEEDEGFTFFQPLLKHVYSNKTLLADTLELNGGGYEIINDKNCVFFTRIIQGISKDGELYFSQPKPLKEEDFSKLESVFPPAAYSVLDRSIPPKRISPIPNHP